MYIDGIDDEFCFYLKNKREFFYTHLQKYGFKELFIISTKSGLTTIDKKAIKYDSEYKIYNYKRNLYNGLPKRIQYIPQVWEIVDKLNY